MAKARRRDWVFAGIAVAIAIAVGIALVIALTDDDEPDSPFTRTTAWKKAREVPEIGTLEYSCAFPGGLQATRLSVPDDGTTVEAGVDVGGTSTSARVRPGERFASAYGPAGAFTWTMVRRIEGGRVEVTVDAQVPSAPVGEPRCRKPELIVFTVRPSQRRQG